MRRALAVHNATAPAAPGPLAYNIDARVPDNLLNRELQEGATGWQTGGWATIGPVTISPQNMHTVSNGDGLCAVFAGSGILLPGVGHIPLPAPLPSSLTVSAFLRAENPGLGGVSLAVEFYNEAGSYISGSYGPTFAVSSTEMRQYYYLTGAVPGNAVFVHVLLQCASAGTLYADFICCRPQTFLPQPTGASQARTTDWQLVFADDFETFDASTWTKGPIGAGDTYGQEQWDSSLVTVANSKLRITTELRNGTWYSGMVHSQNKRAWQFGYFEARIKPPAGQGTWVGWWIFPNVYAYGIWPRSGEIDILEHLGRPEQITNGYGSTQKDAGDCAGNNVSAGYVATGTDWSLDWHTWGLLWERSTDNRVMLRYFVDGIPYGMFDQSMWPPACGGPPGSPYDQPFFAILNMAIGIKPGGPTWAGEPDPAISGRFVEVDWVRVWQR